MGQTEITGHCDGLMFKNGEHNVVDFAGVESHRLFVPGKSSPFCMQEVIVFLSNLADMHWKPSACFGLCVNTVPMAYHPPPSVLHRYGFTRWFRTGFSTGTGRGTAIGTREIPVPIGYTHG
jgi:hypothetical protein